MVNSSSSAQTGASSKSPRKAAHKRPVGTRTEKRLPSSSGAIRKAKTRKRSRPTAASALDDEDDNHSDWEDDSKAKKDPLAPDENGLYNMRAYRLKAKELYLPSVTHQLIHVDLYEEMPPQIVLQRPFHALYSVATPSQFDISVLTIPLTAKELVTFFPNHVQIPEVQDRFSQSDIQGTWQTWIINVQHHLQGLDFLMNMDGRNWYKKKTVLKPVEGAAPDPIIYTTSHYTFTPGIHRHKGFDIAKIPYPLINCADGVAACDFPKGVDCGPFTKALICAQLEGLTDLMLSELDTYIAKLGIDRKLADGYSDADFKRRHEAMKEEYKAIIKKEIDDASFRWEL